MFLDKFLKTYNEDNGWYGPVEHKDGRIMVSRLYRDSYTRKWFTFYKCVICEEYVLASSDALKEQYGAYQLQVCCMNPSLERGSCFKQLLAFTKLHEKLNNNFNKYSGIEFNREIGEYYLINKQKGDK